MPPYYLFRKNGRIFFDCEIFCCYPNVWLSLAKLFSEAFFSFVLQTEAGKTSLLFCELFGNFLIIIELTKSSSICLWAVYGWCSGGCSGTSGTRLAASVVRAKVGNETYYCLFSVAAVDTTLAQYKQACPPRTRQA